MGVPRKRKNRTAIVSSNPTSGYTVVALCLWDMFQDPQWMPETKDSTKLFNIYIYIFFLYKHTLRKFNL